jgi:cupin fold WbuC family metalloprotein
MKLIDDRLIAEMMQRSATSPRRRTNHNVHEQSDDVVQRLFIAAEPDSYFRPHRHRDKPEFALVVRGAFDVLVFDEHGVVTQRFTVGPNASTLGFETPPATFHTLIAKAPGSILFEAKRGPYDPQTAAEFAPWSPAEGSVDAQSFFDRLQTVKVGESVA